MKKPELSIIIPTLNERKYLPKLLKSIRNQHYDDLEIIVADSNSTDGTREIAEEYGCVLAKGGRPAIGRNNGARQARGSILLFLDCDVLLTEKDYLDKAISEFKTKVLDVACASQTSTNTGKLLHDGFYKTLYGCITLAMIGAQNTKRPLMQCCMFATKEAHDAVKGFNEKVIYAEDTYYARDAVRKGFKFGMLTSSKVSVSPRRYENGGAKLFFQNAYFFIGMLFGYKFKANSRVKYHEHHEEITA